MVTHKTLLTSIKYYYVPQLISQFFLSSFFDYWFPYRIHLYIRSAQHVNLTHHMSCFFKTLYSPKFFPIYYFNFIPKGLIVSSFSIQIRSTKYMQKVEGSISRNIMNITIKMKTILQIHYAKKKITVSSQKFRQINWSVLKIIDIKSNDRIVYKVCFGLFGFMAYQPL